MDGAYLELFANASHNGEQSGLPDSNTNHGNINQNDNGKHLQTANDDVLDVVDANDKH